jgi:hypothetical protein
MHYLYRIAFVLSAGILLESNAKAQTLSNEALLEKLTIYSKANPSNILFVHTDKTVYTNNETVWFSAYIIKNGVGNLKDHTILSVAMVREDNREVFLQDKYAMQNGLSFGSMSLPDSIPPGNYQFIASTNLLDKDNLPYAVFTQSLTIKSITQNNFNTTLTLLDTVVVNGAVRAKINVEIKEINPKEKATVEYSISKGAKQAVGLKENSAIITIPVSALNQSEPVLLTSVKYNKEIQYLSLKLPAIESEKINVRFFPEGGNLVNGLESTVGWEAKTNRDLALAVKGVLYKNDLPIDTISTNSYGIGNFKLKSDSKSHYTLRVAANPYLKKDTLYTLPQILENGIVMHLANALVNDTLRISLLSSEITKVKVFVHNYHEAFASFEATAKSTGSKVTVYMPVIPKGIAIITVLDTLGRPLAERLFIARYDQKITGSIQTDKPVYTKKDSVHVQIKLSDKEGLPVQGIVSIASVQDNRLESSKQQDIESYVYLNHDLGYLPQYPKGRKFSNKEYLENILLVKGWRKYTWQSLIKASSKDTVLQVQSPVIKGNVKYNDKPLKNPVVISISIDSLKDLVETSSDGFFGLNREKLLINEGQNVILSVIAKDLKGYSIEVQDPFIPINQKLADQLEVPRIGIAQNAQNNSELLLKDLESAIALPTVVIHGDVSEYGTNACGDYVCYYNILNCWRHPFDYRNRKPVKGKTYLKILPNTSTYIGNVRSAPVHQVETYQNIIYMGCSLKEHDKSGVRGIYTSREFYGVNGDSVGLTELQYLSTLFWNPGMIINKNGEAKFSFFTGDITGKFRIVVQGVSNKDVIFGEGSFTVK